MVNLPLQVSAGFELKGMLIVCFIFLSARSISDNNSQLSQSKFEQPNSQPISENITFISQYFTDVYLVSREDYELKFNIFLDQQISDVKACEYRIIILNFGMVLHKNHHFFGKAFS